MARHRHSPLLRQTVVVTGASAGIGRAVALRFGGTGARVGLIGRDELALAELAANIEALGGTACVAPADVANPEEVFSAADKIAHSLGPIEIWVNNAMVTVFSPFADITPEEFRRVTEVTYLGCVYGTQAALRHMRPCNRGTIIQVGSALAYRGIPLQAAYCGAKHAIRGFTDSLRTELIYDRSKIELTVVELPAVNTPQFDWARTHLPCQPRPVPPVVQPEVIADAIYRASLKPRREYWIGRSTLGVILGNLLLPAVFDRLMARKAYSGQMTKVPVRPQRRNNLLAPVHDLHRIRGLFGAKAARSAMIVSGPAARLGTVIAGAVLAFCVGALAHRSLLRSSRTRR